MIAATHRTVSRGRRRVFIGPENGQLSGRAPPGRHRPGIGIQRTPPAAPAARSGGPGVFAKTSKSNRAPGTYTGGWRCTGRHGSRTAHHYRGTAGARNVPRNDVGKRR